MEKTVTTNTKQISSLCSNIMCPNHNCTGACNTIQNIYIVQIYERYQLQPHILLKNIHTQYSSGFLGFLLLFCCCCSSSFLSLSLTAPLTHARSFVQLPRSLHRIFTFCMYSQAHAALEVYVIQPLTFTTSQKNPATIRVFSHL